MWMSMLLVLVLILAGIAVLMISVTGQAAGTPITATKRVALFMAGLIALGCAYMVYRQPDPTTPFRQDKGWNAMPSAPPETRGDAAIAAVSDAAAPEIPPPATPLTPPPEGSSDAPLIDDGEQTLAAAELAMQRDDAQNPAPGSAAPAAVADGPAKIAPAPAAAPRPQPVVPIEGLSASAAAYEAEQNKRFRVVTRAAPPAPTTLVPIDDAPDAAFELAESSAAPAAAAPPAPAPARATVVAAPPRSTEVAPPPTARRAAAPRPVRRTASTRAAPAPFAEADRTREDRLTIHIHNELGDEQTRERLHLIIEGKRVASFTVDENRPSIALPVGLPRPGLLNYRLEGEARGSRRTTLRGEGCIDVENGLHFDVRRQPGSRRVFLQAAGDLLALRDDP